MFKRANKITALLVAAASIMSVVPAMAADTTRLGNKEGTVKQGVAYGDGSFAYYGYKSDDDDTGVYVAKSGEDKPKLQDDLEDYRLNTDSKFGEKYVYAKENSNDDEYLIDLSTGKIVDDETVEEKADNAKNKLVSKIKKADRYEDLVQKGSDLTSMFDADFADATGKFSQILPAQFGEVWYKYEVTTGDASSISYTDKNGVTKSTTDAAAKYIGFSDESGKYIDLSQDTNIRIYSTKTKRAEYIKEFDKLDKDADLYVRLVDVAPLAQDKDSIYALTTVLVTDTNAGTDEKQYFVQKISKAQGSKDDGEAYTAKSIDSYLLQAPNAINEYSEGDFDAAYEKLITADSTEKMLGVVVKDSTLYIYAAKLDGDKSDKLQVWKLKLGKFKKDVKDAAGTVIAHDVDVNAVKKDGDTDDGDIIDFDLDSNVAEDSGLTKLQLVTTNQGSSDSKYGQIKLGTRDLYRLPSVSIDTTGTVWALEKGKVLKFDGTDKKTVYTVDRAMDAIDAYDENNIIIWDTTGDVYTNISEGQKVTKDDGIAVDPTLGQTTPATVGWKQEATGWTFYDVNGTKTANYWVNDNGTWYYIKADGIMATGWQQVNGTWYYLKANGAMATGWLNDNGTWYYLASSGAMLANTTVDGYKLGASGAWIQ